MKKFISVFIFVLFALVTEAQTVSKTIDVATAGTLSTLLTDTEKSIITDLTVTGNIDARDIVCMRDVITKLANLDISTVSIKSYTGWNGTDPINERTYPANEMPAYSFLDPAQQGKKVLKTIKLPNSITSIGERAFGDCSGLTGSLTIPNSVTSIKIAAFYGCSGLTGSLTIPNSVTSIEMAAFSGCGGFTGTLTIGSSVTSIGSAAFPDFKIVNSLNATPPTIAPSSFNTAPSVIYVPASGLSAYKAASTWSGYTIATEKRVTINNPTAGSLAATIIVAGYGPLSSITHLTVTGNLNDIDIAQMKTNMKALTDIDLSDATLANNALPANAFASKTTLTSVKLPSSLLSIGNSAFSGCSSLSCVPPIPASVTSIGDNAFYGCIGFTGSLTIPNSVTSIGSSAFSSCSGFTGSLTIPNSVTSIRVGTFSCCSGLSGSLTLPNSLTAIGSYAFSGCSKLSGAVTFPSSVTSIGDNTFDGCKLLTELSFGKNTTSLGYNAFNNCTGVNKITVEQSVPPTIGANTFGAINKETCSLIVPTGSSIAYQIANYWSDFIFFSEKDFTTYITKQSKDRAKVFATQSEIIVEGTASGENVTVYTLSGVQLQSLKSRGERIVISAPQGATYLVKTSSKTVKVTL